MWPSDSKGEGCGCGLDSTGEPSKHFFISMVMCFMYCLNYIIIPS
jgi:hypothetical protein